MSTGGSLLMSTWLSFIWTFAIGDLDIKLRAYFEDLLKKDDSFDTVERVGTVMFVMANHDPEDIKGIIEDVKRWKPGKYLDDEIIATVQAIENVRQKLK